jgi:hypothetical protein
VNKLTLLVAENKRSGDVASHPLVRGGNKTVGSANSVKGVLEEIQVALVALGALVNNLGSVRLWIRMNSEQFKWPRSRPNEESRSSKPMPRWRIASSRLTIVLIFLPLGPVTSIQAPQLAAKFQLEPEKAVP